MTLYKTNEVEVPSWVWDEDHRPESDRHFLELKPLQSEEDLKRFRKRIRKDWIKQQNASKKAGKLVKDPNMYWMERLPWHNL